MLTLVFGATAFATSTILASLFAGLALGGFYFGRVIDKGRNPLLVYALLETGIGIFAFLMPLLFSALSEVYVGISRHFAVSYYQLSLLRFALSFLVLLVPATLMGGTLPVIVKFFAKRRERLAWNVGHLYATNTLGAGVGTVAAGFFLILLLGVKESAYAAGVVNLFIAGIVFVLDRRLGIRGVPNGSLKESEREPEQTGGEVFSSRNARLALWAVGISGLCALAFEVFWTRALVFFLDNSTHAFTTILTAFLLGIAIGSFIIARFIDSRRKLLAWLGVIQVLIGVSAILAIPILNHSTPVFESLAGVALDSMLPWKWMGMRFVKSLAVMLVPTVLMGMTFPLVSKIYTRNVNLVGTALGNVYSANTIGGVFGSVIAGFVLIPLIGVQHGIIVIAGINVIMGGVLILSEPLMTYKTRMGMVVASGALFISMGTFYLTGGAIILTSYYEGVQIPEVLSYQEGIGGTVKVYRDKWGEKVLSVNGFPVAGTAIEAHEIQKPLAHLPLLLSAVPSPRVNIIGFGTGGTSWGVTQYNVAKVDCVELVPAVIDAAKWFPETNHGVLSEPRFNVILGDGRNYALVTDKEYDVISVDATSPKMAGNGSLYALEFYELLKGRLSDDGMVVQWLPFHLLADHEVRMIAKTFMTAFPHTTLWFTPMRQHIILVGTQRKLEIDFRALSEKLEMENVQRELGQLDVSDPFDVLSWFVMGEEALTEYVGNAWVNTDDHPYLEFTPAMAYFVSRMYRVRNTLAARELRESVFPFLINVGETDEEIASVAEKVQKRFE
ncbi:MAG: fused MFS/spermidine synthase, partial [Gemmatimonadetes bacterium]|nr:fused MFS/spermidine synthase [Gemmatimonadota bacterium]